MRPSRIAGLLLAAALATGGCAEEEPVETAGPELLGLGADQVMVGMEHLVTREGILRARIRADTAYTYQDSSVVHLQPFEVTFYGPEGATTTELTARRGTYDLRTNDVEAFEDVVVLDRQEDQRLETEELRYDARANELTSDRPFALHRSSGILRGAGFVSDPELDTVRVRRPAGEAREDEAEPEGS